MKKDSLLTVMVNQDRVVPQGLFNPGNLKLYLAQRFMTTSTHPLKGLVDGSAITANKSGPKFKRNSARRTTLSFHILLST